MGLTSLVSLGLPIVLVGCSSGSASSDRCTRSDDCAPAEVCVIQLQEARNEFDTVRCEGVGSGYCKARGNMGGLFVGCWCYYAPNESVPDLPDDGQSHLACAELNDLGKIPFDAGTVDAEATDSGDEDGGLTGG